MCKCLFLALAHSNARNLFAWYLMSFVGKIATASANAAVTRGSSLLATRWRVHRSVLHWLHSWARICAGDTFWDAMSAQIALPQVTRPATQLPGTEVGFPCKNAWLLWSWETRPAQRPKRLHYIVNLAGALGCDWSCECRSLQQKGFKYCSECERTWGRRQGGVSPLITSQLFIDSDICIYIYI